MKTCFVDGDEVIIGMASDGHPVPFTLRMVAEGFGRADAPVGRATSFCFRSVVGVFSIRARSDGRFTLELNGDALGSYHSPRAAADDVYSHHTGARVWDRRRDLEGPTDISEWEARRA